VDVEAIDLSRYDTDKSRVYLTNYARECGHLAAGPIALLELGVKRGGSLLLWRDLLPQATIAGLDLNPVEIAQDGRIRIYQGFQQDPAILDRIAREVAPDGFDLIIDDASHLGEYTAQSFWHLFPNHLKPGGTYVIEDWGTGYWPDSSDGHAFTGNRATIGDRSKADGPAARPGQLELLRRHVRSAAAPVAATLSRRNPRLKRRLRKAYTKVEGIGIRKRFPSHDYGMVGFVKQLIDACAIEAINRATGQPPTEAQVASVHVYRGQVFIHKSGELRNRP